MVIVKFGMSQFTVAWRNAVWELFMCKFTVKTPDFSDSEVPKWGLRQKICCDGAVVTCFILRQGVSNIGG